MFQIAGEPLSVSATILGYLGDIPITNTMTTAIFDLAFFLVLILIARSFKVKNPGKVQIVIESILQVITSFIEQVAGNRKIAWRIMPLVVTLVLFILVSNLIMTFLPILSGFTYEGQPLFRSHTNDFNTTLSLAVGMVVLTQVYSIRKVNLFGYITRFIQIPQIIKGFSQGIGQGFIAIINAMVGLLDLVSEFAKIISLSLRLFGNMFAGELLIGIFMSFSAILLPIPIMGLSTLSGVVQAIVFGSLVASFFAGVLQDE